MAAPSLLERAREGDAAAIAALLGSSLRPQGIAVRAERESYTLHLWLTASPAPPQGATVAYVRRAMARLQAAAIGIVALYGEQLGGEQLGGEQLGGEQLGGEQLGGEQAGGEQAGGEQAGIAALVWREEIALLSLDASDAPAPGDGGAEARVPELSHPAVAAVGADTAPPPPAAGRAAGLPAAVVRAYRELGVPLGAPLAEVESLYFKRRATLLSQGDRAALEPLKWAFTTLKTHLEQPAPPAATGPSLGEAATATAIAPLRRSPSRPAPAGSASALDDTDILAFDNRYSNGLIFPVLLLVGMAMNALPLVNALLWGIKIWIHEFGHATVAWLAGRRALPLPIGWTSVDPRRSLFVYLGIVVLLGLLYWAGRREGQRWPMGLAIALAIVQFVLTWLVPADTFAMLLAFGGVGGEIYLSALLMVSFYFPLPAYFRWDFYRFPVVLGAAFCFWGQVWLWQQVPRGNTSIPFGSLWGEADHGDMNQLINVHGWTPGDVIGTYSAIAHLCLLAIVAVYGYTLFRQHRETFVALGRQWLP